MDVKQTLKNTDVLQNSLNTIFLAIGNAYYEANKAAKNRNTKDPPTPLSPAISAKTANEIKQGRTSFLDSLDQLDILVTRATEVLERQAKQQAPSNIPRAPSISIAKSGEENTGMDVSGLDSALDVKGLEPSPESMLLNGEGLLPPVETPVGDLGLAGVTPASVPALPVAAPEDQTKATGPDTGMNDDMISGGIDFGDFDTSFFDDTNFDFGMMMDD